MKVATRHPNDMSAWPEIACQQGHATHDALTVTVDLSRPHGYHDLPAVRSSLAFRMRVFDWEDYAGDGPYCPGRDVVSETVSELGIWEPAESILALKVCADRDGEHMLDFGAQIGWFAMLALANGMGVEAVDADPEPLRLLEESAALNGWEGRLTTLCGRIGPQTPPLDPDMPYPELDGRYRFVKVDVEGAEGEVVRVLMPLLRRGRVDHLLIEVSPMFGDYYGGLLREFMDLGYVGYLLPDKSMPPAVLEEPKRDLIRLTYWDLNDVSSWPQRNIWFRWTGATW